MGGSLTVSERILFHLHSFTKYEDKYEVPFHLTQDGISQSCGISRAHAAIELKKLKSSGLVEERLSHVRRGKTRRKAYLLTFEGKSKAVAIHQYVSENDIDPAVDASRVPAEATALGRKGAIRSSPMPTVRHFFGREREIEDVGAALQDPARKLVVIRGIPGIGKTTLAVKLLSQIPGHRVFWHSVRAWDTSRSVAESLGRFFSENGNRRLDAYLASGGFELGEMSFLLRELLSENGYVFAFDDADASAAIRDFLQMFRQSSGAGKILMMLENESGLYERSEVVASGAVFEYELGGLSRGAALEILKSRGIGGDLGKELVEVANGHPLSLEMVTRSTPKEARSQLSRFFEEKFYNGLSEDQKSLLQLASVFQKPFPAEAIPRGLRGVRKGSMLREVEPGAFEIHASIRDFVYGHMAAEERTRWHGVAADYYLRSGDRNERLLHLFRANRVLEAEMLVSRLGESLLSDGNVARLWQILERHEPMKDRYRLQMQLARARLASMHASYDLAWQLLEEVASDGDAASRAEALIEMGCIKGRQGAFKEASRLFADSLETAGEDSSIRAKAQRGLGVVESKMGRFDKAKELLESSAQESLSSMDKNGVLKSHLELGGVLMALGDYEKAVEHFSKCAAGFGPVDLANAYLNLGVAYSHLGRVGDARQHLENSVRLCEETGQPKTRAHAQLILADVLLTSDDLVSARERCYEALEVFSELGDHASVSTAYATLGRIEGLSGNAEASEECVAESMAAAERVSTSQSVVRVREENSGAKPQSELTASRDREHEDAAVTRPSDHT
ncbi:TPA: tetratricopeptide repeat protein [Thermoplasmata archaeon]|nr:tetratricopeptide repeat protein [Thermoplasmata archaeon]